MHARAYFGKCLSKALLVERLQQVVDCIDFERAQGVLVIGSDENDRGQTCFGGFDQLKAVQLRHLDIQKSEIGREFPYGFARVHAVGTLANDPDVRLRRQQLAQPLARQSLVVYDQGSDGFHSHLAGCRRSRTVG